MSHKADIIQKKQKSCCVTVSFFYRTYPKHRLFLKNIALNKSCFEYSYSYTTIVLN